MSETIHRNLDSDRQCQMPGVLLEPSMNFELSLYHHCDDPIMSAMKTCCMMIEDILMAEWTLHKQSTTNDDSCGGGLGTYFHQFIATFINLSYMHLPSTHCDVMSTHSVILGILCWNGTGTREAAYRSKCTRIEELDNTEQQNNIKAFLPAARLGG